MKNWPNIDIATTNIDGWSLDYSFCLLDNKDINTFATKNDSLKALISIMILLLRENLIWIPKKRQT